MLAVIRHAWPIGDRVRDRHSQEKATQDGYLK